MAKLCCFLVILLHSFGLIAGQTFASQPESLLVKEGEQFATFACGVQTLGNNVLSIRKGPDVISDGGNSRDEVLTQLGLQVDDFLITSSTSGDIKTFTLYIRNIKRVQAGRYQCIVCSETSNSMCDENNIIVESDIANVTVAYPPSPSIPQCSIQSDSGSTQVFLAELVTLICVSGSAVPDVTLGWTRDGQDVSANVTHAGGNSRAEKMLTVQNALDGAVFTCQLSYQPDSPASSPDDISEQCSLTALKVVSLPVVTVETSGPINLDGDAVFTCTVSSSTSSFASNAIQWTVPSSIEDSRYTVSQTSDGSVLTISTVQNKDHGIPITCSATDDDGITASASEMLLIEGRPPPTSKGTTPLPSTASTTPASPVASFPLGAVIAGVVGGLILLILVCSLIIWLCRRRRHNQKMKKKQATHHTQIPMTNAKSSQAMPDKVGNHTVDQLRDGKDYPDERAIGDPDVIPREKHGGPPDGVDPRKWWRETMPPTDDMPYERSVDRNDYPTIKGMKMPFQDRSSPYMNAHDGSQGYDPVGDTDRDYHHYDRNFSDSGYREPHYSDAGYEDQHSKDKYENGRFEDRGSANQMPSDYDYDNQAYEQSHNSQSDPEKQEPYSDRYNDQYNDQHNDQYNDQYDDQYNDQYNDRYDDRPDDRYDDQYDDGHNKQYDDQYNYQPNGQFDDQYNDQPYDRYDDRYESYGHPDGQEEYDVPQDANNDDYYPKYDQDERIPDGHSSSNEHYSATPYDDAGDMYGPSYNDQPSDHYGSNQDYSGKQFYGDDLRNSQGTPSYV